MFFQVATDLFILLFSVIIHEVAHGWVALRCGDSTARDMGRLTLNPLPHIDPFMTVILPVFLALQHALLGGPGIIFGGAKPVPVNPYRLRGGERDHVKVSLAGAGANILLALALGAAGILGFFVSGSSVSVLPLVKLAARGMAINLFLANFNLLPIPPLDGSWVLSYFLKGEAKHAYSRLQARGFQAFLIFMVVAWLVPGVMDLAFAPSRLALRLFGNLLVSLVRF